MACIYKNMNCKLCNQKKLVTIICTVDQCKMCESCAKEHVQRTNHAEHIVKYIEWFKKQNELELGKLTVTSSIKKSLIDTIEELPSIQESLSLSLESRKAELKKMIENICQEKIAKANETRNSAKLQFERAFNALYSKTPSSSGLTHIISNLTKEQEVQELVFSEIIKPSNCQDLRTFITTSLDFSLKIYKTGKSISLPYPKPNSSKLYWYNIQEEKLEVLEEPNTSFSMYYAWCMLPNLSFMFSGGCTRDHITKKVFNMQPRSITKEKQPSMCIERYMHAMIHLDGWLYCFGGVTNDGNTAKSEKWLIGSSFWEVFGNMNTPRVKMTVCAVAKKIFIGDENDIEVYNPQDNTFKILSRFKSIHYMIMIPIQSNLLIFRKNSLYEVTLEPAFVTKLVAKIPVLEYSSLSQPVYFSNKIFFILDSNKSVYSFDYHNMNLKLLVSISK